MNTTAHPPGEPPREPSPEEIAAVLAEVEALTQPPPAALPAVQDDEPADAVLIDPDDDGDPYDDEDEPRPLVLLADGETRRVQKLRQEVAEAHLLAELQDDDIPLTLDTSKVRKLRRRTWEAARLHELGQHPAAIAYRDAKVRRVTTTMVMSAAGIALAVSSIGVQASVVKALDLTRADLGWWASYGVEAVLSLPLLAAVGVQAYSAIRGRVVDRKSAEGRRLFRVELVLLAMTLVLNCWPAFRIDFDLLDLIVHSLGPVAAVLAVWVLPTLWKVLSDLPVPTIVRPTVRGGTGREYRGNASGGAASGSPSVRPDPAVLADKIRVLIQAGVLPPSAGVQKIREALRAEGIKVGTDTARDVRDLLAAGSDSDGGQ
ncbi:hypothetical protein ABZW11_17355 [Nonomuraea sp. NPDC004580]|uniref:hypothetical protein n=1 Tax=Nonomuraea sp. NPDC004580 TaxID=3154552 RepID=UPI0033B5B508